METDKHYFLAGLFVLGGFAALAVFAVWLVGKDDGDGVVYRTRFADSVSGLTIGERVKFHGVDVGTVKLIELEPTDPRQVRVDISVRKDVPVKTDTKAMLKTKGVTGVVFVELSGGDPKLPLLSAQTPAGQVPEIASVRNSLDVAVDELPKVLGKFSTLETQMKGVVADVGEATAKIKENPSVLVWGSKRQEGSTEKKAAPAHR